MIKVYVKKILVFLIILSLITIASSNINAKSSKKEIKNFDFNMRVLMHLANMPSISACIIKNDTVVWNNSYGFYNRCVLIPFWKWEKPDNKTLYMIGSISKTFTATAILQLYERGLFNLSDDVNDYLNFSLRNPNYPNIPITFEMLLSHQSSLNETKILIGDPVKFSKILTMIKNVLPIIDSTEEVLKNLFDENGSLYEPKIWDNYPPGKHANYSNLGFITLSYLIEKLTNQSYEDYIQDNIFDRLNMNDTFFHYEDINNRKIAIPTLKIKGLFIPLPHYDFSFSAGAGGIRTTTDDLSRFLIAHMTNGSYNGVRILNESTTKLMHTVVTKEVDFQYGLGWHTYNSTYDCRVEGHGGNTFGAEAKMLYNKSDKTGVIVFWNEFRAFVYKDFPNEMQIKIVNLLFEKAKEF